uniref:C-type lectin domain-containing protein n=1 Tax=Aquila chrysaetos chrysaetos TaxID=223781 RepID=A0A663F5R1_AQUCH
TGEESTAAMMPSQQRAEEGTSKHQSCFEDVVSEVVAVLSVICLENGIRYREKCFYFVEDEADWNRSQISCLSLGAHLATIDTQEELHFLFRYGSSLHYWIGLHREGSGPWKWSNGSLFSNRYVPSSSSGEHNHGSDWCSQMKYSAATHKSTLAGFRRIQKS